MTTFNITLPLDRTSPVHIPIRDLVLGGTDSGTLLLSLVDCDSPDALPIDLTGGIGGPAVSLFVWPDGYRWGWGGWGGYGYGSGAYHDYGWGWYGGGIAYSGTVLWAGHRHDPGRWPPARSRSPFPPAPWELAAPLPLGHLFRRRWWRHGRTHRRGAPACPPDGVARDRARHHADRHVAAGADRRRGQRNPPRRDIIMSTTIGGIPIIAMPDLGAVNDTSSFVGERAAFGALRRPPRCVAMWRRASWRGGAR